MTHHIIFVVAVSVMVQYHALGVLYHIRKADKLAVTKLLAKLTKSHMKSPFAVTLLVSIPRHVAIL